MNTLKSQKTGIHGIKNMKTPSNNAVKRKMNLTPLRTKKTLPEERIMQLE